MVPQRFTRYAATDNCRDNNSKSISRKGNGNYSGRGRDSGKFCDSSSIVSGSGSGSETGMKSSISKVSGSINGSGSDSEVVVTVVFLFPSCNFFDTSFLMNFYPHVTFCQLSSKELLAHREPNKSTFFVVARRRFR